MTTLKHLFWFLLFSSLCSLAMQAQEANADAATVEEAQLAEAQVVETAEANETAEVAETATPEPAKIVLPPTLAVIPAEPQTLMILKPTVGVELANDKRDEVLWNALEVAVAKYAAKSGFTLVNRSSLAAALTEAEFQRTHLVKIDSNLITPEEIQAARMLLKTTVEKFDSNTWYLSLSLLDGSTLQVIPEHQYADIYGNIGEMLGSLDYAVKRLLGQQRLKDVALFVPGDLNASPDLDENLHYCNVFLARLRFGLLQSLKVSPLEAESGVLKKMHLASTADFTARDFIRFGELLGVRYICVPAFTTSKVVVKMEAFDSEEYARAILDFAGSVKVVDTLEGEVVAELQLQPVHAEPKGEFNLTLEEYAEKVVTAEVEKVLTAMADDAAAKLLAAWTEFNTKEEAE